MKSIQKQPILIFFSLVLSIFYIYKFQLSLSWFIFTIGLVIGANFFQIDRMCRLILEGKRISVASLAQVSPLSRSLIGLIGGSFLMIFVISTSNSLIGIGLVLGIGLRYAVDLAFSVTDLTKFAQDYRISMEKINPKAVRYLMALYVLGILLLNIFTILG